MKYVHLDDAAISIGGTNFTSIAILGSREHDIEHIPCSKLTMAQVKGYSDRLWILGNITGIFNLDKEIINELLSNNTFIKIEFDYNFCQYRGEMCHQILGKDTCSCPHGISGHPIIANIYDLIVKNNKFLFFMSQRQRAVYLRHLPFINFNRTEVLSSCFTKENFELFAKYRDLRSSTKRLSKYAIFGGFGGWHSEAKGTWEAKRFCESNKLDYDILQVREYEDHIKTLSMYEGVVFLPIVDDTCPRSIIESKLLGLKVITNENAQHVSEYWWDLSISEIESYLSERPNFFWRTVDETCSIITS
jgi:hypothetical protein